MCRWCGWLQVARRRLQRAAGELAIGHGFHSLAYGGPVDQLFLALPEQTDNGIIHDAGPAQQGASVDQRGGRQADEPASPFDPVLVEALNGRAFSHYADHKGTLPAPPKRTPVRSCGRALPTFPFCYLCPTESLRLHPTNSGILSTAQIYHVGYLTFVVNAVKVRVFSIRLQYKPSLLSTYSKVIFHHAFSSVSAMA